MKLSARKCAATGAADEPGPRTVVYKGPFAQAANEDGHIYRRGQRTQVSVQQWDRLAHGPSAAQFLFVGAEAAATGCGCG